MNSPRTLLVGLGSPHGDDRAGWLVAEAVAGNVPGGRGAGFQPARMERASQGGQVANLPHREGQIASVSHVHGQVTNLPHVRKPDAQPPGWLTVRLARSPAELLDWLEGIERLVVCDACRGSGVPGRTHCWHWPADGLERLAGTGSHDFSLPQVLELAGHLGRLPPLVEVWTVEAAHTGPLEGLSSEVEAALTHVIHEIRTALQCTKPLSSERS